MKFIYQDQEHSISFKREHREVIRFDGEVLTSTYPYTTVTIEVITRNADGKVTERTPFRTASAGVLNGDNYTFEKGRLAALRSVSRTLDRPLKVAVWKTYLDRERG